jgi:threonine/homoserine/homoserine lactone efflux protein
VDLGVFVVVRAPGGKDDNVDIASFARGLALGFAVAAPVGPMSLLCMRRTLASGFAAGVLSGLGVATADALYGAIAAFGLVAITGFVVGQQPWLQLAGGAVLVYLGLETLQAGPADTPAAAGGADLAGMYLSTLALALANPTTILSFAALFAGLGLGGGGRDSTTAPTLVLGVFLGSALWWLILTGGIALARGRLTSRLLRSVNTLSGLALLGFGLTALASLLARP